MPKSSLPDFLKKARTAAGLSQGDVARKLGYGTAQFISSWERGISSPPAGILYKLAAMYGVSAEALYEAVLEHALMKTERDLREEYRKARRA